MRLVGIIILILVLLWTLYSGFAGQSHQDWILLGHALGDVLNAIGKILYDTFVFWAHKAQATS